MDSNRREYNLVCKQQAIPENIHATFTQSTSSFHVFSRWSAPFVPESWLWYGVVAINNLDKTCHNLLRGSPEALKSISIPSNSTNWYVVELTRRIRKLLMDAVLSAARRGCFECKPVDEFHLVTRYIWIKFVMPNLKLPARQTSSWGQQPFLKKSLLVYLNW